MPTLKAKGGSQAKTISASFGKDEEMPVLASGQANMNTKRFSSLEIELLECSLFAGPNSTLRLTILRQKVPVEADSMRLYPTIQ